MKKSLTEEVGSEKRQERTRDLTLGELVEKLVSESISYYSQLYWYNHHSFMLNNGTPSYLNGEAIREGLYKEYQKRIAPLKEELDRRERLYKNKSPNKFKI